MAEEEVVVAPPTDLKRRLGATETEDPVASADVADGDSLEAKRPRIASENGVEEDKPDEDEVEKAEEVPDLKDELADNGDDAQPSAEGVRADARVEQAKGDGEGTTFNEQTSVEHSKSENGEKPDIEETENQASIENSKVENGEKPDTEEMGNQASIEDSRAENVEKPDAEETENQDSVEDLKTLDALMPPEEQTGKPSEEAEDTETTSRRIEVPNDKVGVLIGKGGETIRYLQYNSGAKIQITRDADSDPRSTLRPVEVIGTLSSIKKAEKLIEAVIEEADAGGSPALVARGLPSSHTSASGDQFEMQVPNEKVGMIIGRGGETIKNLQSRSGARIQLIPQHLPEGDGSKERTVRITGNKRQIEIAREMIVDVMNQTARPPPSHTGGYNQQQSYRSRGPAGPSHWGPRGPHSSHPMPYDHRQRGPYPPPSQQYSPSNYGGYPPQQMAPRGNFGSGWEQRPPPSVQGPPPHGGYDYYGSHGGHHAAGGHGPTHGPTPSSVPAMGPPPSQANYNYPQGHGGDYGHQATYSQTAPPQQSYSHGGYNEPKYDNHPPPHPAYGVLQNQPGYGAQQQYGKQSYGMPSQGPPPQAYGALRPTQPSDVPYQGSVQSNQSYGPNVPPPQQQYPYVSSAPVQQAYPSYGSAPAADGYNQATPVSASGYPQQAAGYVQNPAASYGSYQSAQHGYHEQPVPNNAGYGYQGPQDSSYASGPGTAYGASTGGQLGYPQAIPNQASYDQSAPQSGGYATTPGSATQAYTAP